ncbi:hypothetical protein [uncultured Jannaschia sp.]|uniref:hypothetical protein n=1 Tax=uncultured Jannaschia sp. TaxID=293347 RepID=UPI0026373781|nr:hypothetical protein [uncultured Jannaschia sp.]
MVDENLTVDLFGDVTTLPSGRRGRPSHRWSQSNANRVIMGLAMGYTNVEIAAGLGISLPTLRRYYFSELKRREMQRTRFELWRAETLAVQAASGNVGAMKELGNLMKRRDEHLADAGFRADVDPTPPPKLGKKEQDRQNAEHAVEDPDLMPGNWH